MTDSEHESIDKLAALLQLMIGLNDLEVKIRSEEQVSLIEIRPAKDRPKEISHDDILSIVGFIKKQKKFLMYIIADSSEPMIVIHRSPIEPFIFR